MNIILNILIGLLGFIGGITTNYAIDVFSHENKLTKPFCTHCKHPQPWKNYFFYPRKCENCQKARPIRVTIVEILLTLITILIWNFPHPTIPFFLSFLFFIYATFVLVMDFETKEVALTISGVLLFGAIGTTIWGWKNALLGGAANLVIMLIFYFLGKVVAKIIAKRRNLSEDEELIAFGFGDVYLGLLMGLALGFPGFVLGLIITIVLGGVVSLLVIIAGIFSKKDQSFTAIAYGPYIIIATVFMLYFSGFFIQ